MKEIVSVELCAIVFEDGEFSKCTRSEASDFGAYFRIKEGQSAFAYWVKDFKTEKEAREFAERVAYVLEVPFEDCLTD